MPEEISKKAKEHANTLMEKSIDVFTLEIVQEYHTGKDGERKNELRNAVKISLNKIANKIDHGSISKYASSRQRLSTRAKKAKKSNEQYRRSKLHPRICST